MREKVIAGNWKMYTTIAEGKQLVTELMENLKGTDLNNKRVIIIPPFLHISSIFDLVKNQKGIQVGGQNCHFEKEGAYTGETSPLALVEAGAEYVILGHSERRQYFKEDNQMLAKKVSSALEEELSPIYCCGETLEEREGNNHFSVVENQISEGLFHLSAEEMGNVVIAYEPVWAIGTGKTASPEQAQEIHAHIRNVLAKQFGNEVAESTIILYGGSVKPNNAAELFGQKDIDGGLVGGASLKAADFAAIIQAA